MKTIRVRFAPSPTGALHIGGVRTALYNFLLARKHGGTMILRIEDTDQTRYVPGAEEYILEALAWAGIQIDEGVGKGGPHAPYRQSERKEIYQKYAQQLIAEGKAYYAFDTEQDLEAMRERLKKEDALNQQYGISTRGQMKNSLTLTAEEVKQKLNAGEPYVIRLKVPAEQSVELMDLIRGQVVVNSSQIDDKVLMKSDGMPTYHLANVVDDYLMQITHVIRGEEWLPSAPLHILLYQSFGWQDAMPQFAHLPLLLKPDGNGKLSKRDADQMGFPIFPLNWTDPKTKELAKGFRESGYLPEAIINFLAFLGWNPGTEQEIFSMEQLTETFTLERIGKAGAKFDIQKAQWFNQQYLRSQSNAELAKQLLNSLKKENISCSEQRAEKVCQAMRERITYPQDIFAHGRFFFTAPIHFDETVISKKWNEEAVKVLSAYRDEVKKIEAPSAEIAKTTLDSVAGNLGIGTGKVLQALRVALTGQGSGPDLMLTIEILGSEETVSRLDYALQNIQLKK
ncbi:MAG: glutamate--tRNA ligase [Flammeovirgaceae bacterium]